MKGQVIFLWTKRPSWKELEAQLHPYLRQLERLLDCPAADRRRCLKDRSEEHTSELQSQR